MSHKHETPESGQTLDRGNIAGSGELSTGEVYSAVTVLRSAATDLRGILSDLLAERWALRRVALLRDLEAVNASLARVGREV